MCEPRHHPDTRFIISEEDFIIYPEDAFVKWNEEFLAHLPWGAGSSSGAASSCAGPAEAEEKKDQEATGSSEEKFRVELPEHLHSPCREDWKEEEEEISQELRDTVYFLTAAHRCGCGDIFWTAWVNNRSEKAKGSKTQPTNSSGQIIVSREGALRLREQWGRSPRASDVPPQKSSEEPAR